MSQTASSDTAPASSARWHDLRRRVRLELARSLEHALEECDQSGRVLDDEARSDGMPARGNYVGHWRLVVSRDAGLVDAQVRKLERAIGEGQGPVGLARSLSEAHVVVQFTEYRRSIGEQGEPLLHWVGQAKLLKQPAEMTVSATPLPERCELLVIGEDGREEHRALKSLELMLSKTLRPEARQPVKEAI